VHLQQFHFCSVLRQWDFIDCERAVHGLFVSLVYCAESTVRWFVVREKHCWMDADSADKSKRTGRDSLCSRVLKAKYFPHTSVLEAKARAGMSYT
jgi:hypothetical protein